MSVCVCAVCRAVEEYNPYAETQRRRQLFRYNSVCTDAKSFIILIWSAWLQQSAAETERRPRFVFVLGFKILRNLVHA